MNTISINPLHLSGAGGCFPARINNNLQYFCKDQEQPTIQADASKLLGLSGLSYAERCDGYEAKNPKNTGNNRPRNSRPYFHHRTICQFFTQFARACRRRYFYFSLR